MMLPDVIGHENQSQHYKFLDLFNKWFHTLSRFCEISLGNTDAIFGNSHLDNIYASPVCW